MIMPKNRFGKCQNTTQLPLNPNDWKFDTTPDPETRKEVERLIRRNIQAAVDKFVDLATFDITELKEEELRDFVEDLRTRFSLVEMQVHAFESISIIL